MSAKLEHLRCPGCGRRNSFHWEVDFSDTVEERVEIHEDPATGQRIVKGTGDYVHHPTPVAVDTKWVTCGDCGLDSDVADLTEWIYECRSCGFSGSRPEDHDDEACHDPDVHPMDPVQLPGPQAKKATTDE